MLQQAYQRGVNLFDTAPVYGPAEEILGEAVRPFRDKVNLVSKTGVGPTGKADLSRSGLEK